MIMAPARKHMILFLAANPSGTSRLALDEECAAIEHELQMTPGRDELELRSKWAVSIDELQRHLNELQPAVIHFSGHGGDATEPHTASYRSHRDVAATTAGIQLQGELRRPQHVNARALSDMIRTAAPSARLVVLNACFSGLTGDALCEVVDCVVGMRGQIHDAAARSFSIGFYRALGYRRSIGNAFAQAVAALAAKQLPDEHIPVCQTRHGLSADRVFLSSRDARPIS
jgi:CHAT domain-containing protein